MRKDYLQMRKEGEKEEEKEEKEEKEEEEEEEEEKVGIRIRRGFGELKITPKFN